MKNPREKSKYKQDISKKQVQEQRGNIQGKYPRANSKDPREVEKTMPKSINPNKYRRDKSKRQRAKIQEKRKKRKYPRDESKRQI